MSSTDPRSCKSAIVDIEIQLGCDVIPPSSSVPRMLEGLLAQTGMSKAGPDLPGVQQASLCLTHCGLNSRLGGP